MLEVGRVCIKTAGREAGRACVVIDTIDDTYVMITGPKGLTKVKRRKCNIAHLEPLEAMLKLAKNAGDSEVEKLLKAEGVLNRISSGRAAARPARAKPREAKEEKPKEKRGLRERLLGGAKKEEKPRPEKKAEKKPEPGKGKPTGKEKAKSGKAKKPPKTGKKPIKKK